MNQNIQKGIIGIGSAGLVIALMLITAGETVYECTTDGRYGVFDRLSSTNKTGYYLDDNGNERSNVCRNGEWIKVKIKSDEIKETIQNPKVDLAGWTCVSNY